MSSLGDGRNGSDGDGSSSSSSSSSCNSSNHDCESEQLFSPDDDRGDDSEEYHEEMKASRSDNFDSDSESSSSNGDSGLDSGSEGETESKHDNNDGNDYFDDCDDEDAIEKSMELEHEIYSTEAMLRSLHSQLYAYDEEIQTLQTKSQTHISNIASLKEQQNHARQTRAINSSFLKEITESMNKSITSLKKKLKEREVNNATNDDEVVITDHESTRNDNGELEMESVHDRKEEEAQQQIDHVLSIEHKVEIDDVTLSENIEIEGKQEEEQGDEKKDLSTYTDTNINFSCPPIIIEESSPFPNKNFIEMRWTQRHPPKTIFRDLSLGNSSSKQSQSQSTPTATKSPTGQSDSPTIFQNTHVHVHTIHPLHPPISSMDLLRKMMLISQKEHLMGWDEIYYGNEGDDRDEVTEDEQEHDREYIRKQYHHECIQHTILDMSVWPYYDPHLIRVREYLLQKEKNNKAEPTVEEDAKDEIHDATAPVSDNERSICKPVPISNEDTHQIDANVILCRKALFGKCNDKNCKYQHLSGRVNVKSKSKLKQHKLYTVPVISSSAGAAVGKSSVSDHLSMGRKNPRKRRKKMIIPSSTILPVQKHPLPPPPILMSKHLSMAQNHNENNNMEKACDNISQDGEQEKMHHNQSFGMDIEGEDQACYNDKRDRDDDMKLQPLSKRTKVEEKDHQVEVVEATMDRMAGAEERGAHISRFEGKKKFKTKDSVVDKDIQSVKRYNEDDEKIEVDDTSRTQEHVPCSQPTEHLSPLDWDEDFIALPTVPVMEEDEECLDNRPNNISDAIQMILADDNQCEQENDAPDLKLNLEKEESLVSEEEKEREGSDNENEAMVDSVCCDLGSEKMPCLTDALHQFGFYVENLNKEACGMEAEKESKVQLRYQPGPIRLNQEDDDDNQYGTKAQKQTSDLFRQRTRLLTAVVRGVRLCLHSGRVNIASAILDLVNGALVPILVEIDKKEQQKNKTTQMFGINIDRYNNCVRTLRKDLQNVVMGRFCGRGSLSHNYQFHIHLFLTNVSKCICAYGEMLEQFIKGRVVGDDAIRGMGTKSDMDPTNFFLSKYLAMATHFLKGDFVPENSGAEYTFGMAKKNQRFKDYFFSISSDIEALAPISTSTVLEKTAQNDLERFCKTVVMGQNIAKAFAYALSTSESDPQFVVETFFFPLLSLMKKYSSKCFRYLANERGGRNKAYSDSEVAMTNSATSRHHSSLQLSVFNIFGPAIMTTLSGIIGCMNRETEEDPKHMSKHVRFGNRCIGICIEIRQMLMETIQQLDFSGVVHDSFDGQILLCPFFGMLVNLLVVSDSAPRAHVLLINALHAAHDGPNWSIYSDLLWSSLLQLHAIYPDEKMSKVSPQHRIELAERPLEYGVHPSMFTMEGDSSLVRCCMELICSDFQVNTKGKKAVKFKRNKRKKLRSILSEITFRSSKSDDSKKHECPLEFIEAMNNLLPPHEFPMSLCLFGTRLSSLHLTSFNLKSLPFSFGHHFCFLKVCFNC